jgi:hypothetical protein
MIRAASIGFAPGIDPIPVAAPGDHGNACCSATMSSLAGVAIQVADAPHAPAAARILARDPGGRLP